ncbi:MAG: hypothetical protein IJX58_08330, partial [Clostridia bacterium]|nr:hypothetical protein [Clostridia bacterium]
MKRQIKITFNYNLTVLVLSIVCVLLGAAACILGELMTPFVMGVLSAIYLFDTKSKRSVSVIVSILLLALNVLAFFFRLSISLFAPASIILSMIVNRAFIRWHTKANTAYLMTLIAAVFSLIGYLLFAMIEAGSFTFDAVIAYYSGLADYLRNIFVDSMMEIYIASGIKVTEEAVVTLFNQQIYMIISYILIGGFAITGIGMKVFSWITAYCSDNVVHI